MAGGGRQIFQEISDDDSIGLTSTEESDPDKEYLVRDILDELWDEDLQKPMYLVRWEDYPLHRATWEPAENFGSNLMIDEWRRRHALIKQGKEEPFDLEGFYELEEKARHDRDERKERRCAKRRKLGLRPTRDGKNRSVTAPIGTEPEDSSEDESLAGRKRQKLSPPKRKGVAQTVKKAPAESTARVKVKEVTRDESDDGQGHGQDSDSGDSLMDELQAKSAQRPMPNKKTARAQLPAQGKMPQDRDQLSKKRDMASRRASEPQNASSVAMPTTTSASSTARPTMRKTVSTAPAATTQASLSSVIRGSGDTSKPAAGTTTAKPTQTAKRTSKTTASKVFTPDWDKQKKSRMVTRVSGETPKDSADPKFTKLSVQNRFQKYSVNEPTPDISKLAVFNPVTGRMEQPVSTPSNAQAPPRPPSPQRQEPAPRPSGFVRFEAPAIPAAVPKAPLAPPQPSHANRIQPVAPPSPPAAGDLPRAFGRRSIPPPAKARSSSPPSTDRGAGGPQTYFHDRSGNTNPDKIGTAVCTNWLAGRCSFGADCHFRHSSTAPRPDKKQVTCSFWARTGYCKKPEWECDFAHHETGLWRDENGRTVTKNPWVQGPETASMGATGSNAYPLPERTRSEPRPHPRSDLMPTQDDRRHETVASPMEVAPTTVQYQGPVSAYALRMGLRRDKTCSFWRNGMCKFQEADCRFAHHDFELYENERGPARIETHGFTQPAEVSRPALQERARNDDQRGSDDNNRVVDPGAAASDVRPKNGTAETSAARRTEQVPTSLYNHVARLSIQDNGGVTAEVNIRLSTTQAADQQILEEVVGSNARLDADRTISASDLQRFCGNVLQKGVQWPAGEVVAEGRSQNALASLAELCKLNVTCAVVVTSNLTLLLYPSGVEEWRFLGRAGDSSLFQAVLRYKLLPAMPVEAQQKPCTGQEATPPLATRDTMTLVSSQILDLDVDRLLTTSIGDYDRPNMDIYVFIMVPPSHEAELQLLSKIFEARQCRVYTSARPGMWDGFRKNHKKPFLLIVHPDVPLDSIPSLAIFLDGSLMRVFSAGVDRSLAAMYNEVPRFSCQRLFPDGRAVFITDSVLLNHPEKATKIIEGIASLNKRRNEGGSRIQIAMRPGIRQWLMQLAIDRSKERGRSDERWSRLFKAVYDMCPPELDLDYAPGNPGENCDIVSVPPEDLPTFAELEKTDEAAAADFIVNWYAGWAISNATDIRRFTICNETQSTGELTLDHNYKTVEKAGEVDPRGWAKEYQHLMVVLPSWWLKFLENRL